MKRGLTLIVILIASIGVFFCTSDRDKKAKLDDLTIEADRDSIKEISQSDRTTNKSQPTGKTKLKEQIPKTIRPDQYAHLDNYARETPDNYSIDNITLAEYLEKPAKSDLEKARLIYSWIATHIRYDDEAFNTNKFKNESADSVLIRRTAVCEGFSSLFLELGILMGLEVEKISGYAKGYGFQPGDKFSAVNHAWNAVKIDNTWQLIDVTWGSQESETTNSGLKTTIRFDPYWFNASPEAFIFSHLPENQEWQLIGSLITMKQYEELPFLDDSFFKMGFDSKVILQKAISGETKQFAETFSIKYPIKGIELPFAKKLARGKEYNFLLESDYLEDVFIIDGGQWIDLKRDGNTFQIRYAPKTDRLQIAVKVNHFDTRFSTIVVYEIVDKKNLTAHNKRFAQLPGSVSS